MKNLKNMKPGFTMIELVFVIVIIGILAAIAIPRFAATRDDAAIVARTAQIKTGINEVGAAATARDVVGTSASMSNAFSGMIANAQAAEAGGVVSVYDITNVATAICLTVSQGTRPWTGVPTTDAAALVTDGAWTQTQWDDLNQTKVLSVAHSSSAGGCSAINAKNPAGVTAVKGRAAQF